MKKKDQPGMMVVFEGMDGAGKTTAARNVKEKLQEMGLDVLYTREPGGSEIAEKIRDLLLDPAHTAMDPRTEALLYAASRAQHVQETILPALQQGKIVLCDRFLDSSLAYQGYARGLGMEAVEAVNTFGLQGFEADLYLFFTLDPQEAQKRIARRGNLNRLDQEKEAFHQKVTEGFWEIQKKSPNHFICMDASGTPDEVAQRTLQVILEAWKKRPAFLDGQILEASQDSSL